MLMDFRLRGNDIEGEYREKSVRQSAGAWVCDINGGHAARLVFQ